MKTFGWVLQADEDEKWEERLKFKDRIKLIVETFRRRNTNKNKNKKIWNQSKKSCIKKSAKIYLPIFCCFY